jgi:hypothetical protein
MQFKVSWTNLKQIAAQRSSSIQWVVSGNTYLLAVINGPFCATSSIPITSPAGTDQVDFETNFKTQGNQPITQTTQPFASKTLPNGQSLYKRFTGISQQLQEGSNTFTWTSSYNTAKILALEVINAEVGDTCSLFVLDSTTGTYSKIPNYPLNQFAFNANIPENFYRYDSEYDAEIYLGMQIQFVYNSASSKTIYINLDINEVK